MTHKTGVTCSPVQDEAECYAQAWQAAAGRAADEVDPSPGAVLCEEPRCGWVEVAGRARLRAEDLERQRDEARAEAERLRLGRVELQGMHRAAFDEVKRLRAALHHIAHGEAGDTQAHDWPEFWESVRRRAAEALKGDT